MTVPLSFRELFTEHFGYVWRVLRRLGVRHEDVEDRAHEVFLNVHRRLADYDPGRPVRPWLFGFAYRVASQHRRTERRRREVIGIDEALPDGRLSAHDALVLHEERTLLQEALLGLDLERRAILVMHDWDGEPIPEVARALGIPLNTAYSRLRLGRADLEAAVKRLSRERRTG